MLRKLCFLLKINFTIFTYYSSIGINLPLRWKKKKTQVLDLCPPGEEEEEERKENLKPSEGKSQIFIRKHHACSAVFSTPRISPSFDPASSQKRWRDLLLLCFSWISLTRADPLREIIAISDVGSFIGIIGSACLVKTTLPSRKGGFVSVTRKEGVTF